MTAINELSEYSKNELLSLWGDLSPKQRAPTSVKSLIRELAYRLQEKEHGKLDKNTSVSLRRHMTIFSKALQNGKRPSIPQTPSQRLLQTGAIIKKHWQGNDYTIKVMGKRIFEYNGRFYKSLSAVAKAITGQHISGPLFFDLKK